MWLALNKFNINIYIMSDAMIVITVVVALLSIMTIMVIQVNRAKRKPKPTKRPTWRKIKDLNEDGKPSDGQHD